MNRLMIESSDTIQFSLLINLLELSIVHWLEILILIGNFYQVYLTKGRKQEREKMIVFIQLFNSNYFDREYDLCNQ